MYYKIEFKNGDEVVKHLSTCFADSIHRIRDIIHLHKFLSQNFPEESQKISVNDDLLRLCVIYLHQCIEDLIRHLKILKKANPLILFKDTEDASQFLRFTGININFSQDLKNCLIDLDFDNIELHNKCDQLKDLFLRRHRIVHHGDRKDIPSENFLFSPSAYESISVEFVEENLGLVEELYVDLQSIMSDWVEYYLSKEASDV